MEVEHSTIADGESNNEAEMPDPWEYLKELLAPAVAGAVIVFLFSFITLASGPIGQLVYVIGAPILFGYMAIKFMEGYVKRAIELNQGSQSQGPPSS